jgi:hypothetical protein
MARTPKPFNASNEAAAGGAMPRFFAPSTMACAIGMLGQLLNGGDELQRFPFLRSRLRRNR